jgi:hypothetical protein
MIRVSTSAQVLEVANQKADIVRHYEIEQPFDVLILGSCASRPGLMMGDITYAKLDEMAGKKVILIPACCSRYDPKIEDELRDRYSEITWEFLLVPDYNGHPHPHEVVHDLVKAGYLKEVRI